MAPSSKKTDRSSQKKRNSKTAKRYSAKKKRKSRKKSQGIRKIFLPIFIVLFMAGALIGLGYCLGSCWSEKSTPAAHKVKAEEKKKVSEKHKPAERKSVPVKKNLKSENRSVEYFSKVQLAYRGEKPKLAIIIDDVHTKEQLRAVTTLPFPVTPSIFPPYTQSPHTHRLATQAVHYMVHLPMESGNVKYDRQSKTLKTTFSLKEMRRRMHELRKLFPRAYYMNNHTGSRFTENVTAMRKLYRAMREEGFTFIDSVTTGKSKVKEIAHNYGDAYVARDIFLDNVKSIPYIHKQLKKALRLAKKKGYAIVIGHPHKITLEALRRAKPLLKEVEVVYIDEIFRRY